MISGISHLRQQIELQEESARRGFYGYAVVSRHDFINAKTVEFCYQELKKLVGEEEAAKVMDDFLSPFTHGS